MATQHTGTQPQGLLMIGTNHRQAPLEFREKVAFLPDEVEPFLKQAYERLHGSACFLLSTCNRTEFYAVNANGNSAHDAWELLRAYKPIAAREDEPKFYRHEGRPAVEQLFRVACGVDSQMLGEPQILQQVKLALDASQRAGVAGVVGERLLAAAVRCGKRARSETEISKGAVSVALAAVSLAHKVFGDLAPRTALVVGAGETGSLAAQSLREHGVGRLLIANRTIDRARALAAETQGEPFELGRLAEALAEADIVITSTSAPGPLVTPAMVRAAMKRRQHRELVLVDIGVPRDVDPAVGAFDNVFLQNIESLHGMIEQNLLRRRREVPKVERIVQQEVDRFLDWYAGLQAGPVIRELRAGLDLLRQQELNRAHLSPEAREAADQVTQAILNKILHRPMSLLRGAATRGEAGRRHIETIREVFGLDPDQDEHDRGSE
jgi:glutamyl-tRNA reductase